MSVTFADEARKAFTNYKRQIKSRGVGDGTSTTVLLAAHEADKAEAIRLARIDELKLAVAMAGKIMLGGVLMDGRDIEGVNPSAVDKAVLEARLESLEAYK